MNKKQTGKGRFIIIVLDGFGVGAMPDVAEVRPADAGANTCLHIFETMPELSLPTLGKLGLFQIVRELAYKRQTDNNAVCGRAMLMHDGADTFFGHHEIMGTLPRKPVGEPFQSKLSIAKARLLERGFRVEEHPAGAGGILVVEQAATVADNIECDPGQAINVTAAIDDIPFELVLEIGEIVRKISTVPRVIAFGGRGVHLSNLLDAIEVHGEYVGVNAPASGVYNDDYHCIHMGYGVNADVQAPTILGRAGWPVYLLGKAADVVSNQFGVSIPMVDTAQVLIKTRELIAANPAGFFCANIQETDLCGHRENVREYAQKLMLADAGIGEILPMLAPEDILIVMADHGNDPTIGHPHHTREMAPIMAYRRDLSGTDLGVRKTLSDVGATALDYFSADRPENGRSFLRLLMPASANF